MPKQRRTSTPECREQIARLIIEESRAVLSTA